MHQEFEIDLPIPEAHAQQQFLRSESAASELPNIIDPQDGQMVNSNVEDSKEDEDQAPVRRSEQERRDAAER